MKRREFVTHSSLSAAAITLAATACKADPKETKSTNPGQTQGSEKFELNELTIDELQEKMQSGVLTSEAITQLYLRRIEAIDKNGPTLQSVIELNPEAISIAKACDAERAGGKVRSRMHGIPVLIKDNIDTADQMMTTAGSIALLGHVAARDAFIVSKLRDAGAVILGKTNLTEWANFRSTKSCSGWSSRGKQTRMPHYLDRNPCGSSSGSGVAVSANLCAVAVGTETDGSITCPASVSALVGLKPTVGLLSRSGIIPISFTQDTAGPLARTVKDAAVLLSVLTGVDSQDEKTKSSEGKTEKDYTVFLDVKSLQGKRIGVDLKKYDQPLLVKLQDEAIALLENQGAEVVRIEYLEKLNALGEDEFELLKFEFKDGINRYLASAGSPHKSLTDLIAFNKANETTVMPTFKQEIFESSEEKEGLESKTYQELLKKVHVSAQELIDGVLAAHHLDALAGLTMGPACAIDTIYGDQWGDVFLTSPAAMAGYPHISVPAGTVYDLPVGFSFFGGAWTEGKLLGMAYAFEQGIHGRKTPGFKARLEV